MKGIMWLKRSLSIALAVVLTISCFTGGNVSTAKAEGLNLIANGDFDGDDGSIDLNGWNLQASETVQAYEDVNIVVNAGMSQFDDADYPGYKRLSGWEPRLDFITMENAVGADGSADSAVKMVSGDGSVVGGVTKLATQFIWDWQTVTLEANTEYTLSLTAKAEKSTAVMFVMVVPSTVTGLDESQSIAKAEPAVGANVGTWQTASTTFNSGELTSANVMLVCYDSASAAGGDVYYVDEVAVSFKEAITTTVPTDNIVANGGMSQFDDADYPGYKRLTGWEARLDFITMENAESADGSADGAVKMISGDGNAVGGVTKLASQFIWDWQTITLEADTEYTLTLTAKAEKSTSVMFVMVVPSTVTGLDESQSIAKAEPAVGANAGTWQTASTTFNSGDLTSANVMIVCYDGASAAGGDVYYVDEVSITSTMEVPVTTWSTGVGSFGYEGNGAKLVDDSAVVSLNESITAGDMYNYGLKVKMEDAESKLEIYFGDEPLLTVTGAELQEGWNTGSGSTFAKANVNSIVFKATGTVYLDDIELYAHIHDAVRVSAVAPTCTKDGTVEFWDCGICGKQFADEACTVQITDVTDKAAGHKEVVIKGKAATSLETGLTDGKKCSVCDTWLEEQKVIPKITVKKPGASKVTKATGAKKKITIKFKKVSGINGYEIQIATKKNMKKGLKTYKVKVSKAKYVAKKLKAKTKYWVRIRTYKTVDGVNHYSSWSKKVTVKTK